MKHPVQRHSHGHGTEWLGAIFTLLVLSGVYASMDHFSSYTTNYSREEKGKSEKSLSVAKPYWNSSMSYGFRSVAGDSYSTTGSDSHVDKVLITRRDDRDIYTKDDVKVSFYPNTPIDDIEKDIDQNAPRAYSRLPNGIAVIEGNLDSPSAKTILSTLHSK